MYDSVDYSPVAVISSAPVEDSPTALPVPIEDEPVASPVPIEDEPVASPVPIEDEPEDVECSEVEDGEDEELEGAYSEESGSTSSAINGFDNFLSYSGVASDDGVMPLADGGDAVGVLSSFKNWLGETFYEDSTEQVQWTGQYTEWLREGNSTTYSSHQSPFTVTKTITTQRIDISACVGALFVVLLFITVVTWIKGVLFK